MRTVASKNEVQGIGCGCVLELAAKGHEKSLWGDEAFYILNIRFLHEGLHLPKIRFIAY